MKQVEILVVGAGVAGIAAAKAAYEAGCRSLLLADQRKALGGILLQCAHRGFGGELTGREYVKKLLEQFPKELWVLTQTSVVSLTPERTAVLSGKDIGVEEIAFEQLVLATGCLEIPLGALPIGGTRPPGIYTAGEMQELMNVCHQVPEGPAVIIGSGDLGLIMAEHLSSAGVEVAALVEQKELCGGLKRNQGALAKWQIPLLCSSVVTEVLGKEELLAVKVRRLAAEEEKIIPCKTLLVAAGLRPDRSLIYDLGSPSWLHLCGNCHRVHPMVEGVLAEGRQAGEAAFTQLGKS